jgi:hypothetical protein
VRGWTRTVGSLGSALICGTVLLSVVMGNEADPISVKVRYRPAGKLFRYHWFCAILPEWGR